jgi:hypothetical protein
MYQEHEQTTRAFLSWVAANLLGFISMSALLIALPILKSIPGIVASTLIITLPIGFAQWLVLRRLFHISPVWVLTLPIGLFLFLLLSTAIPESLGQTVDGESTLTLTAMYIVLGAAMGLSQWLILRRKFSQAVLWIGGSSLGVGLGFGLVLVTGLINQSEFISYATVVLVYGIATGSILSWLLLHTARTQKPQFNAT